MPTYNLPDNRFGNLNLNALGSQYASDFNKDENKLIQRITNNLIFDAAPRQFFDLAMLNMLPVIEKPSDEFQYMEMGYQREALVATASASAATAPATQTITLDSVDNVSVDLMIVYPTNEKGTVVSIDKSSNQITVAPMSGQSVPAVSSGDKFGNLSPVEADAKEGFSNYFRSTTVERYNYVQMISKAMRFGRMELAKYMRAGTTSNYLAMNRAAMFRQTRIDISNILWNGDRGEVTLQDGTKAKTAGGIYPLMTAAGSPNASTTTSELKDAFEDIAEQSEYGDHGDVRFAFMDTPIKRTLSKQYKDDKTRYRPADMDANIALDSVDIGSSKLVLIPFHRFADSASFPSAFKNRIFIIDPKNLRRCQVFPERSGEIDDRSTGAAKNYKEIFVDLTFSIEFNNPLACGWIDVN